ncbi:DUF2851 family protein [Hymenobacter sp. BT175]|uniref:DUF2851 family protein n=1 Tax=Hymenobacter translucens TaxID=2886507 RepID=UPI001D0E874F|nr:DUF2851 family protein [Hymenobacter translucens]MCC2545062.1 DUF2851 family protein [Hymenobacter translucens]
MQEDFIHYLWQQQYFDKTNLTTTDGEPIVVLRPGYRNADAGPDFLQARVRIGEVEWNGAVEIHLRASDWHRHDHQHDPRYDQVVLHVVHRADQPVQRTNGTTIPTLDVGNRVFAETLDSYAVLLNAPPLGLPCAPLLTQVPGLTQTTMVTRALMERLEQKAAVLSALHRSLEGDWEATTFHALAAGFGFKKNGEAMTRLAKALPLPLLRRHRHNTLQTEALVFGQAGLLEATPEEDEYLGKLRREYEFLCHKYYEYDLGFAQLSAHDWNFLRLRPANFPTVRLAQLAALLSARPAWFEALLTAADVPALQQFFRAPVSGYWKCHYMPMRPGKVGELGKSSLNLLIINVVVPLRLAYAAHSGRPDDVEAIVGLLESLPAEHNQFTDAYREAGFANRSAADSQGLVALQRGYCQPRRCLQCAIGSRILRQNKLSAR